MSEDLFYKVNSVQKLQIEDICKKIKRYEDSKDFITEALGTFITWWTDPEKVTKIMEDMSRDFTPEMIEMMKKTAPVFSENLEQSVGNLGSQQLLSTVNVQKDGMRTEVLPPQAESTMQFSNYYNDFMNSLNDAKEKIESMKFKEPKDFLPYDEYPLIWSFYSRFFPIKIVISVLAHMLFESNSVKVPYKEFHKRTYEVVVEFSQNLRNYENAHNVPRNQRISTGLPVPKSLTNVPANKQAETMAKIESSRNRFLEHYVGMTEESWKRRSEREPNVAYFDGALSAMNLIYVTEEVDGLYVTFTQKGADFYKLQNPVIHNGSLVKPISEEERNFILNSIIPGFELEKEIVKKVMSQLEKASREKEPLKRRVEPIKLNQAVREAVTEYVEKNPEDAFGQGIVKTTYLGKIKKKTVKEIDKMDDDKLLDMIEDLGSEAIDEKDIIAWRVATMGRLSEIGNVIWAIDRHGISFFTLPK